MVNEMGGRQLFLYHANANGNGCAMGVELRPARTECEGCVVITFANQKDETRQDTMFPRFDWDKAVKVKLDLVEVAMMLAVFRGERESMLEGGRDLVVRRSGYVLYFNMRHVVEPCPGYVFGVTRIIGKDYDVKKANYTITLSSAEALALSLALENSTDVLAFGK